MLNASEASLGLISMPSAKYQKPPDAIIAPFTSVHSFLTFAFAAVCSCRVAAIVTGIIAATAIIVNTTVIAAIARCAAAAIIITAAAIVTAAACVAAVCSAAAVCVTAAAVRTACTFCFAAGVIIAHSVYADIIPVVTAGADILAEFIQHCDGRCGIRADTLYPYVFRLPQFIHHCTADMRNISAAAAADFTADTAVKVDHHTAAVDVWQLVFKLCNPFARCRAVKIADCLAAKFHRYCHIAWGTAGVAVFGAHNNLAFDNNLYPGAVCVAVHQFFGGVGNPQRCKLCVYAPCAVHKACAAVDKIAHAWQNNFFVYAAAGNTPHVLCTYIKIFTSQICVGNAELTAVGI